LDACLPVPGQRVAAIRAQDEIDGHRTALDEYGGAIFPAVPNGSPVL
jgi:hypothetical protein